MNFNEYQQKASRTMNWKLSYGDQEQHALHGLASEVGEVHSIYQKQYQGHFIDYEHVKKEIGDVLWFVAELCTANDWLMDEIAEENIRKLEVRYPDGFDKDKSLHRKAGDI